MNIRSPSRAAIPAVLACMAVAAQAQELPTQDWQYEAGPSIWATGVSGYLRPSPAAPVAHFNDGFTDMRLNAAILHVEAGRGPWGVLADIYSIDQSRDSDPLKHGQPGKTSPDGTFNLLDLVGAYRMSNDADTHFDLLVGIRYSSLDLDVTEPASLAQISCTKCHHNEHWTDGIAGFRVEHRLLPDWWLNAQADIGGGGSKTTWQGLIGVTWHFDDGMSAKFGYRVLSMDFENTRLYYNLKTAGLYAGLMMRF
ncbi:MAG: hypothetical protein ACXWC4_16990 [Telluria sp.]